MQPLVHVLPSGDGFVRTVEPYVHTYHTHVKARWSGKSLLEVYCDEFGGYSKQYYEAAILSGAIMLSNKQVSPHHILVNGQHVLSHTIHLHEPAVIMERPDISIISETEDLVVVDKPSTMVTHPTGASRYNSLLTILEQRLNQKLFTIHRLDRVTSGICLFAKSPKAAQKWTNLKNSRVHKYYLARVKGRFPLGLNTQIVPRLPFKDNEISGGSYATKPSLDLRERNAFGYWTSHESLLAIFDRRYPLEWWLKNDSEKDWLHLACPTRVAEHKDFICCAGSFDELSNDIYKTTVKAAQTAFGVVSYCIKTDSTLVVCKPSTGRSHQIRVHLQFLGHPIATDTVYGGDVCLEDPGRQADGNACLHTVVDDTADVGAPEGQWAQRDLGEGLETFVARICSTCRKEKHAQSTGSCSINRGIWLRSLKYQVLAEASSREICSYQAGPPAWVD